MRATFPSSGVAARRRLYRGGGLAASTDGPAAQTPLQETMRALRFLPLLPIAVLPAAAPRSGTRIRLSRAAPAAVSAFLARRA